MLDHTWEMKYNCFIYSTTLDLAITNNKMMATESLMHYLNSYGCRIKNINDLNKIILNNLQGIQYQINNNYKVCNN